MTTLGLIILVAFVGLFAFAGLRLTPVYLNYMKVLGVINGVQEEFDGTNPSRSAIRSSISRRFDSEGDRYWQIREQGGSVYWETSPDGCTWTEGWSTRAPGVAQVVFVTLGISSDVPR